MLKVELQVWREMGASAVVIGGKKLAEKNLEVLILSGMSPSRSDGPYG